jgi:hypothetical protein
MLRSPVPLDPLTAFGVASVSAMLLFYALERRGRIWIVAFALACWSSALYGWFAGAWPFTIVEGIWGFVALARARR